MTTTPDSVLVDTLATAARERARLTRASQSRGVGLWWGSLRDRLATVASGEAADAGRRYLPPVWTVLAIVALSFYLPGRVAPTSLAPAADRVPSTPVASAPTDAPPVSDPAGPVTDVLDALGPTPVPPSPGPTFGGGLPPEVVVPEAPAPTSTTTVAPVALRVRGFGWADSLAGSPAAGAGVPDGTIPVASRLGQVDKVSFVRLTGNTTTLILTEDTAGGREALGQAAVVACAVTDQTWREEAAQSFDEAPVWGTLCVAGTEVGGTWTFDLTGIPGRTGQGGIALVPGPDAPPDFQVTFAPAAPS